MRIERRDGADGIIIVFLGEVGDYDLLDGLEAVQQMIREGATRLVFNLNGLQAMNSSALGYMIKTQRELRAIGGELVISDPSDFIRPIVATLGIDRIIQVCANDDEALAHIRAK